MANTNDLRGVLKKIGEHGRAQRQSDDRVKADMEASGELPKPQVQGIKDTVIQWDWYPTPFITVMASYCRNTGIYSTQLDIGGVAEVGHTQLTPEDAKVVGEALLSAWQWGYIWQQHAGEYLTFKETPEIDPFSDEDDSE